MRTTPPALRRVAAAKKAARSRKKMQEARAAKVSHVEQPEPQEKQG